jgi:hypothetical protein
MNRPPTYDSSPEGLARDLFVLASLIEFWLAADGEASTLSEQDRKDARLAYPGGEDTPEIQALAKLPPPVRRTFAESIAVGVAELEPVLAGEEGSAADRPGAVKLAQGKIRGLLRIVQKLAGGLPGWIGEVWDVHVSE